tara:strand:+ start:25822 stop:26454 length:633 start_codon:yes stop_codon:yes gene_type:complete
MKIIISIFICLITSALIFSGCKKKKVTYVVEGKVTNTSSATGLSNLQLKVELKKSGNAYYTTLTTVTTDSQGKYSFSIENDLYEKVKISATPSMYFEIDRIISYGDLNQESNVYNINTSAKSWARLIFNNINPNPGDVLQYIKQQGKIGCNECCPADQQYLTGAVNDTIICINDGNSYYSYLYSVQGTSNTGIQAVYTSAFDTATLILNY